MQAAALQAPQSATEMEAQYNALYRLAEACSRSKMVPKQYQGNPDDAFVAILLGAEIGVSPMQAMQGIATINGRPSAYGDLILAICQSHPRYVRHEITFDAEAGLATCTMHRQGIDGVVFGDPQTFSFADAERAGLAGKAGTWQQFTKDMLIARAVGRAAKRTFADALRGLVIREEAQDSTSKPAPVQTKTSKVKAALGAKRQQAPVKPSPVDVETVKPEPATDPHTQRVLDEIASAASNEELVRAGASAGHLEGDARDAARVAYKARFRELEAQPKPTEPAPLDSGQTAHKKAIAAASTIKTDEQYAAWWKHIQPLLDQGSDADRAELLAAAERLERSIKETT
jgi:hypothetical protein